MTKEEMDAKFKETCFGCDQLYRYEFFERQASKVTIKVESVSEKGLLNNTYICDTQLLCYECEIILQKLLQCFSKKGWNIDK